MHLRFLPWVFAINSLIVEIIAYALSASPDWVKRVNKQLPNYQGSSKSLQMFPTKGRRRRVWRIGLKMESLAFFLPFQTTSINLT